MLLVVVVAVLWLLGALGGALLLGAVARQRRALAAEAASTRGLLVGAGSLDITD